MINIKQCPKCDTIKNVNDFSKTKNRKDGYQIYCKECIKEIRNIYRRTINGVIHDIYNAQKQNARNRNAAAPNYTFKEFKDWILSQHIFLKLYNNWIKSNYNKYKKPSADRKDDYKSYSFDNIQ